MSDEAEAKTEIINLFETEGELLKQRIALSQEIGRISAQREELDIAYRQRIQEIIAVNHEIRQRGIDTSALEAQIYQPAVSAEQSA